MAISAQRFNFLDQETNVPVANFTKIADNFVYSALNATGSNASSLLNQLNISNINTSSITNLLGNLSNTLSSGIISGTEFVGSSVKSLLNSFQSEGSENSIVNDILSSLSPIATSVINSQLTSLLTRNLTNQFAVFGTSPCKSQGFNLNQYGLYNLNLDSLLMQLLNGFLNRYCPVYSYNSAPLPSILSNNSQYYNNNSVYNLNYNQYNTPVNYTNLSGVNVNSSNLFSTLVNSAKDYFNLSSNTSTSVPINAQSLVSGIYNNTISLNEATNLITTQGFNSYNDRTNFLYDLKLNIKNNPTYANSSNIDSTIETLSIAAQNAPIGLNQATSNQLKNQYASKNLASSLNNSINQNLDTSSLRYPVGSIENSVIEAFINPLLQNAKNSTSLKTENYNDTSANVTTDLNSIIPSISSTSTHSSDEILNYIKNFNDGTPTGYRLYNNDANTTYNAVSSANDNFKVNLTYNDNQIYSSILPSTTNLEKSAPSAILDNTLTPEKTLYAISSLFNSATPASFLAA